MRRAFTLIEVMTVIAITAILLTIIIVPVFQSFTVTRQAQAYAEAQDKAKRVTEQISREIGNSAAIRDNAGVRGTIRVVVPARPASMGGPGGLIQVPLPYTKVDLIKPAEGEPVRGPSGALIDPLTGKEDPTLKGPKGQIVLPIAPGSTLVRYFISLRDPFSPYNNPHDGLLMTQNSQRDNLYVLRRAEIQPYVFRNLKTDSANDATRAYRPNLDHFRSDDATDTRIIDFDDPAFMIDDNADPAKDNRITHWVERSTILTEDRRYDAIQAVYDRRTRVVAYDGNAPRLIALIQFRPNRVSSEPAQGMQAVRLGSETDNANELAPDVYRTQYGGWTSYTVRTYPQGWLQTDPDRNDYLIGRFPDAGAATPPGFSIFGFDPDVAGALETQDGVELFDLNAYTGASGAGQRYAFTFAILQADTRSNWVTDNALFARWRTLFAPYYVHSGAGRVYASFGINEVGDSAVTPPLSNPNNLPAADTGPALSPIQDSGAGAVYSGAGYQINSCFNRVWNENPNLRPNVQRFLYLPVTPQADGTTSPMHPTNGFPRATVVSGSEEVTGPDQIPGPNYGSEVRYTRTTRAPGPNQYRINYVNQIEPEDYSLLDPSFPATPPATYTANDLLSAVIQPRYKAGYIQLNSDPNVPLPEGVFKVFYRFQFSRPSDVVAVDYDSRQIMQVLLTVKNYPTAASPNPQMVTLKSTAAVRNYIR